MYLNKNDKIQQIVGESLFQDFLLKEIWNSSLEPPNLSSTLAEMLMTWTLLYLTSMSMHYCNPPLIEPPISQNGPQRWQMHWMSDRRNGWGGRTLRWLFFLHFNLLYVFWLWLCHFLLPLLLKLLVVWLCRCVLGEIDHGRVVLSCIALGWSFVKIEDRVRLTKGASGVGVELGGKERKSKSESKRLSKSRNRSKSVARRGFDPLTFGLWAQHASPAPPSICLTCYTFKRHYAVHIRIHTLQILYYTPSTHLVSITFLPHKYHQLKCQLDIPQS